MTIPAISAWPSAQTSASDNVAPAPRRALVDPRSFDTATLAGSEAEARPIGSDLQLSVSYHAQVLLEGSSRQGRATPPAATIAQQPPAVYSPIADSNAAGPGTPASADSLYANTPPEYVGLLPQVPSGSELLGGPAVAPPLTTNVLPPAEVASQADPNEGVSRQGRRGAPAAGVTGETPGTVAPLGPADSGVIGSPIGDPYTTGPWTPTAPATSDSPYANMPAEYFGVVPQVPSGSEVLGGPAVAPPLTTNGLPPALETPSQALLEVEGVGRGIGNGALGTASTPPISAGGEEVISSLTEDPGAADRTAEPPAPLSPFTNGIMSFIARSYADSSSTASLLVPPGSVLSIRS